MTDRSVPSSVQLLKPVDDRPNVFEWYGVAPSVAAVYRVQPVAQPAK